MCLLLFAFGVHPDYPLVVAANRDEYYRRASAGAAWWEGGHILAGRDLEAGGTWMGVNRAGRFVSVTNYRDPASHRPELRSRGLAVAEILADPRPGTELLRELAASGARYNGFNLVFGDRHAVFSYANRGDEGGRALPPGIYGLSNHLLETPWPKVVRGKAKLAGYLADGRAPELDPLLDLLHDTTVVADDELPATGVGLEWERLLSPMFIVSAEYGTRASTAIVVSRDGLVRFAERSYGPGGGLIETRRFEFQASA